MVYDGIITKPDLTEENMLMHWGVKGMRWKKGRVKGMYYSGKSKLAELRAKRARGSLFTNAVTQNINKDRKSQKNSGPFISGIKFKFDKTNGRSTSQSGQEGSRVDAGTAAGRKRALENALKKRNSRPSSRKKTVASRSASVKRRGKA